MAGDACLRSLVAGLRGFGFLAERVTDWKDGFAIFLSTDYADYADYWEKQMEIQPSRGRDREGWVWDFFIHNRVPGQARERATEGWPEG